MSATTKPLPHVLAGPFLAGLAIVVAACATAGSARATAPPVGPLPPGPVGSVVVQKGQLVAFALPHRPGGRVWRIARPFNSRVLSQVSEGNVGASVVLIFRSLATGTTTVAFALTLGERSKAYESRVFTVRVR